jgi:hypothetical protein
MPSMVRLKYFLLGVTIFIAGIYTGKNSNNLSIQPQTDRLTVRNSEPLFVLGQTTALPKQLTDRSSTIQGQLQLENMPLTAIIDAYRARLRDLNQLIASQFPTPQNDKEKKSQIEDALNKTEILLSEKTWSARSEIRLGNETVPVTFILTAQESGMPGEDPQAPTVVSMVAGPDGTSLKNTCWTIDATFPTAKTKYYTGGGGGGCLENLSKHDGSYFIIVALSGEKLGLHYSTLSVSVPQAGSTRGKFFLLGSDSSSWNKESTSIDWVATTPEDAAQMRAAGGSGDLNQFPEDPTL